MPLKAEGIDTEPPARAAISLAERSDSLRHRNLPTSVPNPIALPRNAWKAPSPVLASVSAFKLSHLKCKQTSRGATAGQVLVVRVHGVANYIIISLSILLLHLVRIMLIKDSGITYPKCLN
jgi:hypothetical protein